MGYAIWVEKTKTGYSAFVPDLPGCVATGRTREAVRKNIASAIKLHLRGMEEDGEAVPEPKASSLEFDPADWVVRTAKPLRRAASKKTGSKKVGRTRGRVKV